MFSMKRFPVLLLTACALWFGTKAWADDSGLSEMEPDVAKEYGGRLIELFKKSTKTLPVQVDADPDKAVGLTNTETHDGVILVPLKGFEEREPTDAEKEKASVGFCYLFVSPSLNPLVDGKPVDSKKVRTVKIKDDDGNEHEATCLMCSVQRVEGGDDWQLCVYGAGKEPLVKSSFDESTDAPKKDLALTIKDAEANKATLVVNFFGKYCTTIPISLKRK
jgi:hypothetical protein